MYRRLDLDPHVGFDGRRLGVQRLVAADVPAKREAWLQLP